MGYNTDFRGILRFNKALKPEHEAYLRRFGEIRHVALDEEKLKGYPDPLREAVELPIGKHGMYFVGLISPEGLESDLLSSYSIPIDSKNTIKRLEEPYDKDVSFPPFTLCPWAPFTGGMGLQIRSDKPYKYLEWLYFLLEHFLLPWGYELSGEMYYRGEQGEHGRIVAKGHEVHKIIDGASLLTRSEESAEEGPIMKMHWMTVGSISPAAREALLNVDCFISDLHDNPPIVLLGIPYDCNHYWRFGQDSLDIYTMDGIIIHEKNLCLEWSRNDFPGKSWSGVPMTQLILPEVEAEYKESFLSEVEYEENLE